MRRRWRRAGPRLPRWRKWPFHSAGRSPKMTVRDSLSRVFLRLVALCELENVHSMNSSFVEPAPVSTGDLEPVPVVLIDPRGADPIRAELLGLERLESHARVARARLRSGTAPACQ